MWQELKSSVRDGFREVRDAGDEISRKGRLQMNIFQAERRLASAYRSLGETVYIGLQSGSHVDCSDLRVDELMERVKYYQDELDRLRSELRSPANAT